LDKALMMQLGSISILSFTLFIFCACFPIFSLLGLFYSIRSFSVKTNEVVRVHSLLVSMANMIVVIYLFCDNINRYQNLVILEGNITCLNKLEGDPT
jgi:hypothetical protein